MRSRRESLPRLLAAALVVFAGLWLVPARGAGQRVASMNVCTDRLLIALADPGQIGGLSRFSRGLARSLVANDARRFPLLSGFAEDLSLRKPHIVAAGQFCK